MVTMMNLYFFIPLIFALFLGVNVWFKKASLIRKTTNTVFLLEFIFSSVILMFSSEINFSIFNLNFSPDKFSVVFIFLSSFAFLLFSIFSKKFILKMHRGFYAVLLLIFGILNGIFLINNIFISLLGIFWIILLFYFLSISYSKKTSLKAISTQFFADLAWYLIGLFLIVKDFARYFVLNDVVFSFENITKYLYKIDDSAVILTFYGFLILIGRMFNLIPFCTKNISQKYQITPFVYCLQNLIFLMLGGFLFGKCYLDFNYLFYQNQVVIALFLLFNFVIYVFLALRQDKMFKFLNSIILANLIISLFSIFSFEKECFGIYAYCIFGICISYLLTASVFLFLEDTFKTDKFDELKIIDNNSKMCRFLVISSMLNVSSAPFLSIFSIELISFMMMFSTTYDVKILNYIPYLLVLGTFILVLSGFGVIYKILIEPIEKFETPIKFEAHQIIVFSSLLFAVLILSVLPKFVSLEIGTKIIIGNF